MANKGGKSESSDRFYYPGLLNHKDSDCSHEIKRCLLIAQLVKNPPAMQENPVQILGWEDPLERDRLPTPVFFGFPCGSAGKESTCNAGDLVLIPRWV